MENNAILKRTHLLAGHSDAVYGLAWNPSSSAATGLPLCLASVGADRTVRLWDLTVPPSSTGLSDYTITAQFEGTHEGTIRSCDWSPCGKLLAAASIDRSASLYTNQRGPLLRFYLRHRREESEVASVCWSACGSMLATIGGARNCITVWKIKKDKVASAPWLNDDEADDYVDFSIEYREGAIKEGEDLPLFLCAGGEQQRAYATVYTETDAVKFGTDEAYSVCDWSVRVRKDEDSREKKDEGSSERKDEGSSARKDDEKDDEFALVGYLRGHSSDVNALQWHPEEDFLVSCSSDHTIKVWAPQNGSKDWRCVQTIGEDDDNSPSAVLALSFNKTGDKMVTCSADGTLKVWGMESMSTTPGDRSMHWKLLSSLEGHHDGAIFSVHWSREGIIATGGEDGIILFEVNESQEDNVGVQYNFVLKEKAHDLKINSVKWHPEEGGILASASDDGSIKVWKFGKGANEDPMEINDPEANKEDKDRNPEPKADQGSRPKRTKTRPKSWEDYLLYSIE